MLLARRRKIDSYWLCASGTLFAWAVGSVFLGKTYWPSKIGPDVLSATADHDNFWLAVKIQVGLAIYFLGASVFYSPFFAKRNASFYWRMQHELKHPIKRTLLWRLGVFVLLPLGLVVGGLAIAIYVGEP